MTKTRSSPRKSHGGGSPRGGVMPGVGPLGVQDWLLALGVLTALALLIAALLDFGDPMARARLEVESGAKTRAETVAVSWEKVLASTRAPAPALGVTATVPKSRLADQAVERVQAPSARIVNVLMESALFEAAAGEVSRAEGFLADLLQRAPDDPRAAEARLHLARWASARGDFDAVAEQRAWLVGERGTTPPPTAWIYGTSAALLSTLVEPLDTERAYALLQEPLAHLPLPRDRAVFNGGALVIEGDPWWEELRRRLAAADSAVDWEAVFLTDVRAGDAVGSMLGSDFAASTDAWNLARSGGAIVAVRRFNDGVRVQAVDEFGLAESVREAMDQESSGPYAVRFGHEPPTAMEKVLKERRLGDGLLDFTVHRDDPLRSGRRELFQLRLVRFALVVLALAILIASIMTARVTERSRRLSLLRSTFVASVSHDLRTPIQSMLLMSETLEQNRVASETSRQRYFGSIRREAQRLRRLVEDLLDGARIDRGEGARVERQDVMTEVYFAELEKLMVERAERADGQLAFRLSALPKTLSFDPDGFHRAIWNLFENALKYGRQPDETAQVAVEISMEERVLVARVLDDGPGIPARLAETIFSPFERVAASGPDSDIEKDTGTGLGLAIVREISRAHGGDTQLEPSSRGARFVATFPTPQAGAPTLAS